MTQPTSEYFFKNILIICVLVASSHFLYAQEESDESTPKTKKKEKKEKQPLRFTSARAGVELLHLAESIFGSDRSGFEFNGDITFNNKYFISVDFGSEMYERVSNEQNYTYTNNGQYIRLGLDYNLLYKKTDTEAVSFGLRYCQANFKHSINYVLNDDFWGDSTGSAQESGLSANWIEVVASFKVKLLKNLYLSPNFRIKFLGGGNSQGGIITIADIPGYGIAKSNTRASVNYSILYRLPVSIKKK